MIMKTDVTLSAKDFINLLKSEGLVIVPRTVFEKNVVSGIPFEDFQRRILRKKMMSCAEISDAKLWGDVGQKAVYRIIKDNISEEDIFKYKNKIKIPRELVISIAASRGFYWQ